MEVPSLPVAPAAGLCRGSEASASCGGSLASSCTEAAAAAAPPCDSADPAHRTHHLLKHCLSQSQRGAALAHFHTGDAREAAKEIARMGQREVQAKFKEVYGSATKSNNNSWLRRKLYEAVGVAPLKANTKGKARKAAAAAARRPAVPKARSSPKAKRACMEATPPSQGLSILDLHQHSGLVSGDTSDSEGGSAYSHGTFPAALRASAPGTPRSGLGLTYAPARQPQQLVPPPAGFVPVPVAEPQSPMACGLHWADGLPAQQQQPAGSGPARLGSLEATADTLGNCGPLSSAFRPLSAMDLEQDPAPLWGVSNPAELGVQPWYFGASMDLACLAPGSGLPAGAAMDCCCSTAAASLDDDDIPLLTLDLGGIDVSI